jgi:hypothetical protein
MPWRWRTGAYPPGDTSTTLQTTNNNPWVSEDADHGGTLTVTRVRLRVDGDVSSGGGDSNGQIRYTTNGGGVWTTIPGADAKIDGNQNNATWYLVLPGSVDLSQLSVQARARGDSGILDGSAQVDDWDVERLAFYGSVVEA